MHLFITFGQVFASPANIYLLKVNKRNTRKRSKICSQFNGAFIVNFKHITHLFLVFLLLTLNK